MQINEFQEILQQTFSYRLFYYGFAYLVIVILIVAAHLVQKKQQAKQEEASKKSKKRNKKQQPAAKQQLTIFADIAILIGLPVWAFFVSLYPVWKDMTNQQYVQANDAQYHRAADTRRKRSFIFPEHDRAYVEVDGTSIRMEIPPMEENGESFPFGDFTGTVWYAENSKIILAFEPEELPE